MTPSSKQRFTDANDHISSGGFDTSGDSNNAVGKGEIRVLSGSLDEDLSKCCHGNESSGTLGFSDSQDHSQELSESSDMVETPPVECEETEGFLAEIVCEEEEESDGEALVHRRRRKRSAVTFCDYESGERPPEDESEDDKEAILQERPVAQRPEKRGQCYYCHKGNRLTEKEACIVCNAKYCRRCILRAMGSMPEGRKCLSCIRFPIQESKRHLLGKSSHMMRRLFHESVVKQIMDSEVSCPTNQLSPESIYVNGSPLRLKELMILQNCPNPPRSLKAGKYWYDKVAGFWGKEGHKPCQIITPKLSVGGDRINRNASNGNTNVLINGREITKAELWMLQSAGVQCAGNPTFWVDPDGTYLEEGMGLVKGKIWERKRTKALCTLLSLPTPESTNPGRPLNQTVDVLRSLEQTAVCKVLLVGNDQSGTSTIYKQARVLYEVPFSEEERGNIKLMIQSTLYGYLGRLLEGREQFEEESLMEVRRRQPMDQPGPSATSSGIQDRTEYTIGPRLKAFSDWLIKIMVSGNLDIIFPPATREYAPYVEELWKDAAIQATYNRRDELHLPRVATYFLDRAVEIAKVDYEPSDIDVLYAEGITTSNGLASMEFSFHQTKNDDFRNQEKHPDPVSRYQLIRVHAKSLGENCKWLEMFEDVGMVLFCVSLTEYDEYEVNNSGVLVNKMLESKRLFERIVTHPIFQESNFLLILNKFDLLEEKIDQAPLTRCEWFEDFNPVISHNQRIRGNMAPLAQRAFHYIAVKYKKLFASLTGRKLYVCPVTALESDTVDGALRYAREVLRWEEEKPHFGLNESSCESITIENEQSSY